jgi:hypothetical protein
MLSPFLIIGLGGSGGKTIRALRQSLALELEQRGWSGRLPDAWQFLHIDSPAYQEEAAFPAALLPRETYLSLNPKTLQYPQIYDSALGQIEIQARSSLEAVLPAPYRGDIKVNGPRPNQRGIGRTISVGTLGLMHSRIKVAVDAMGSPEAVTELSGLSAAIGRPPRIGAQQPTVYVVSSLVGLTGSGILLDAIEATKSAMSAKPFLQLFSILFSTDIFEELGPNGAMAPNTLGAIAELVSAGFRRRHTESSSAVFRSHGLIATEHVQKIGASLNYIVRNRRGQGNHSFESSVESFFMVANALKARMIDPRIEDHSRVFTHYFPDQYLDKSELTTPQIPHSFSPLGFSRVNLGLDKFRSYSTRRIVQEAIETILWKHISEDPEQKVRTIEEWIRYRSDAYEAAFLELLDLPTFNFSIPNQSSQFPDTLGRRLIESISLVVLEQGLPVAIELLERAIESMSDSAPALVECYMEPLRIDLRISLASFSIFLDNSNRPSESEARFWAESNLGDLATAHLRLSHEQNLIDPGEFPSLFDGLARKSVGLSTASPISAVMREIFLNVIGQQGDSSGEAHSFLLDPGLILELTKSWLTTPGSPFETFLNQGIVEYLDAHGDKGVSDARTSRFVSAFTSAIQDADPSASLDQNLMSLTHGSVKKSGVCSGIPLEADHPSYRVIMDAIIASGYNNPREWFIASDSGSPRQAVEILTQMSSPVNPLVIGSLLGPISSEWIRASGDYASRSYFINWRRGRELPEAIPAHEDRWHAMLRGWHVARLLNMFENETEHEDYRNTGPKLSVWTGPSKGWKMFPYPLHSSHIANDVDDYPAIVLDSLIIALANCYSIQSLEPLDPYIRLIELGGSNTDNWPDLKDWILNGKVQEGGPTPRPERAGRASDAPSIRRSVSIAYVTEMLHRFELRLAALGRHVDPSTYPIVWQIKDAMRASFSDVLSAIRDSEASDVP